MHIGSFRHAGRHTPMDPNGKCTCTADRNYPFLHDVFLPHISASIYQHPAQTNRHMGTLWGLLHRPNKKTRCAWRFSLFYWHMVWADVKPRAIAQSEQAQCQSAQIHFCILAHISLQELFYMHTKAICKPTTRCSQFYYLHCYATGSSSSNQCLNSMALMVVATSESGKYLTGPTTRRIH